MPLQILYCSLTLFHFYFTGKLFVHRLTKKSFLKLNITVVYYVMYYVKSVKPFTYYLYLLII